MSIDIRYARPDEFAAVVELDGASFGLAYDDDAVADARTELDLGRVLVAVDGARVVGASAELAFRLALPGRELVPVTGLTWVSVDLTHRRRGIVRSLIERQVRDAAAAGDAAVVLYASEAGIYGRYGFGAATAIRRAVVQRTRARLAEPVDTSAVQRLTTEPARPLLVALHERWHREVAGSIARDDARWTLLLRDRPAQSKGGSALQHLVHPDGYLSYRVRTKWEQGQPEGTAEIVDYLPGTPEAHAALWQTLLGLDLVARISSYRVPADDPLPERLTDRRAMDTTHLADGMWVRPTDVAALLGGRCYGLEIDCVLGVTDPLRGDARYRLQGGPDGASCVRTTEPADVGFGVADVGALALGGVRLGRLVRAGRVRGDDAELLRRLELALLGEREPFGLTQF